MRESPIRGGMRRVLSKLFPTLLLLAAPTAGAQIYADVSTSMGNFTIQLNHTAAPKAVANFVSLAEGSRAWVNPVSGSIVTNTPYYNGVTFHRVIKDFMSQTGSRKGDGSDNPGYRFQDEVSNGLTHSGPHVVSMANSGTNTNGAQFFITDVATPHLNGRHSVFGTISSGQAVVDSINNVATTDDKPNTPVVIKTITIRRVGAAAQAFDVQAQGLPVVSRPETKISVVVGGNMTATLTPPLAAKSHLRVMRSTNLQTWSANGELYLPPGSTPAENISGIETKALPTAFYHFYVVDYSNDPATSTFSSDTFTVDYPGKRFVYAFNAAGTGGTFTIIPTVGATTQSSFTLWDQANALYLLQVVIDHGTNTAVHGSLAPPRYLLHTLHADFSDLSNWGGRMTTSESNPPGWRYWNQGAFTATR